MQIPGYEPEQLAPDWRSTVQEVWDQSAAVPGTVKHVCVRRWESVWDCGWERGMEGLLWAGGCLEWNIIYIIIMEYIIPFMNLIFLS